jgi:hypothetical protein
MNPVAQHNGSFESGSTGWVRYSSANWAVYNSQKFPGITPYHGSNYLAFNYNTGGSIYEDRSYYVPAGQDYSLSAWVSSQGSTADGTMCVWLLGSGNPYDAKCQAYSAKKYEWKKVVVNVKSTKEHDRIRIQFYPSKNNTTTLVDWVLLSNGTLSTSPQYKAM